MGRSDETLVGRVIGGKFAIEALIGSGAMGQVYRARQIALDKTVAVKVLNKDLAGDEVFAARFHREAMAASRLDHPNSMRVIDFGVEADGMLYIAMEYLPGRDLHRILHEEGPLPDARIVDILTQALSALAVAHDLGVIHRDLKPENIMILEGTDDEGRTTDVVKVCDFGIAKISGQTLAGTPATRALTTQGLVVGTPEYMSPEQGRGDTLDARSDLYSMGVILFQLMTGQLPFQSETALGLVFKQVNDPPPEPSSLVPGANLMLEAACLKALSKRPADRHQTAREMRAALRSVLSRESMRSTPAPLTPAPVTPATIPPVTPAPMTGPRLEEGAFERADTENVRVAPNSGDALRSASLVDAPRTSTGTATLMTVPVSQPNVWVLGAAALVVGAGITAFGAMEWSYPRKVATESHTLDAAAAVPSASPVARQPPPPTPASAERVTAPAVPTPHPATHPSSPARPPVSPPSSVVTAPLTVPSSAASSAQPGGGFSLTTSAAIPSVTRATGVTASEVRAALPSWKFTECYRAALQKADKPLDGHITLALTMDGTGAVTRVTVRGSGSLLSGTGECMMDAIGHVVVANVAPTGGTADVDLNCTPR